MKDLAIVPKEREVVNKLVLMIFYFSVVITYQMRRMIPFKNYKQSRQAPKSMPKERDSAVEKKRQLQDQKIIPKERERLNTLVLMMQFFVLF